MDVNNFGPFQAEVWGTYSDWIMVLVTIVTAIFLWRTLNSQMIVQKLQQQTTNIENERFRLEVKPNFTMLISKKQIKPVDDQIEVILILDCQLLQAECRNLTVTNSSMFGEFTLGKVLPDDNKVVPVEAHRLIMVSIHCQKTMFDITGINLFSTFCFEDTIGNKYKQTIVLYLTYTEERIDIIQPTIDYLA
jgi:hypothetical protein